MYNTSYLDYAYLDIYQDYLDIYQCYCYNKKNYERCFSMAVSYNKLWKLLIDRGINKTQLKDQAKISTNAIAKLGRNENVSLDTLEKICVSLSCRIEDVVTFVDISTQNTDNNGK